MSEFLKSEIEKENCEWHLDDDESGAWESACGQQWCFDDGDPEDNGKKFCPFCGRHLIQRALATATPCPECGSDWDSFFCVECGHCATPHQ